MTREEAIKFLSNTKVYVNGQSREIQEKLFPLGFQWKSESKQVCNTEKPFIFIWSDMNMRYCDDMEYFTNKNAFREITVADILSIIIDEPKYRPFKDAEECFEEMKKHEPFGWVISRSGEAYNIWHIGATSIRLHESICGLACAMVDYVFADGTPFGVKEEEE